MSLYLAKTRIEASRQHDVVTAQQITQEGQCLMFANDNGSGRVQQSDGTDAPFAGVSISHTMVPTSAVFINKLKASGTTLTLPAEPISGQIVLFDGGQELTAGSAGTANQYELNGKVVTLHTDQADKEITCRFRYELTVQQAVQLFGESSMPGEMARYNIYDRIGVITRGIIATDQYVLSDTWEGGAKVKMGANGQFTTSGSGAEIPNCVVLEAPNAGNGGWLVLNLQ